jgi:hypothetical protein
MRRRSLESPTSVSGLSSKASPIAEPVRLEVIFLDGLQPREIREAIGVTKIFEAGTVEP